MVVWSSISCLLVWCVWSSIHNDIYVGSPAPQTPTWIVIEKFSGLLVWRVDNVGGPGSLAEGASGRQVVKHVSNCVKPNVKLAESL